jgi:hopene-associated glycosyltransferase HpnB
MLPEMAGGLAVSVWLYLLFARGGFWREFRRPAPAPEPSAAGAPRVAVVIPARNEASGIGRAIESLAGQEPLHIVVVDDASEDGTADRARQAAPPGVLTVLAGEPLPAGWTGKLWAVEQGVRHAARFEAEYLLLTDADIVHAPGTLGALAGRAQSGGYDLVSYMATLDCRTLAERALVPAFVYFFLALYPPAWIRDPRRQTAGAAGGCILIRREALERIGGIASIRGELIDDCALARAVKQSGGRVWLGLSAGTTSIREYATLAEIESMIARTAFTQLRHSPLLLGATLVGLAITYLLAPALALAAPPRAAALGAAAWLLMSASYVPALRFYRQSVWWAPLLPAIAVFYACATVHSALDSWRGAGGVWKGRACGADPPVRAGRPRPATSSQNQAPALGGKPARGPAADGGVRPTTWWPPWKH